MSRKSILFIGIILILSAPAVWSLTSHKDYATMAIKDCNACHESSDVTLNHGALWTREHRLYAEKHPNNCKDCHQQSFCLDCHYGGGIDRDLNVSQSAPDYLPKSHVTDWREMHPIRALDDPRSCYRCHDAVKFCQDCHSKFNPNDLRVLSHRRGWSDLEVKKGGPKHSQFNSSQCQTCHPNSLVPSHRWSSDHAREARKNLTSCQSCHADGQVCLKCHSAVTGLRVNPHPRGWDKISNKMKNKSNERTCIKCHITVP